MILGLHHVAISVPDMGQALDFYCRILGCIEVMEAERDGDNSLTDRVIGLNQVAASMRLVKVGNAFIELWQFRNPAPRPRDPEWRVSDLGYTHICLQVQDIGAEHQRLSTAGMRFVGAPVSYGTMAAIYGRDPFGNVIEIYEVLDKADPTIPCIDVPLSLRP
jgi:catechol 2,3-dioxygenase-like lactoylglutathione lyase family enzyme